MRDDIAPLVTYAQAMRRQVKCYVARMILCSADDEAFSLTEDEYVARYVENGLDRGYALFVRAAQRDELDPALGPFD